MRLANRLLAVVLLCLAVVVIALGAASFTNKVSSFQPVGFEARSNGESWLVTDVSAAETGLYSGDRILMVNGELAASIDRLELQLRKRSRSELLVERGDALEQVEYVRPALQIDFAYLVLALIGVVYLLIGLYTLARGIDRQVVLFNLWCLSSAAVYLFTHTAPYSPLEKTLYMLEDVAFLLLPPLTLHFFLTFPRAVTGHTWLKRTIPFLYLPAGVLLALQIDLIEFDGRYITGPATRATVELVRRLELIHLAVYVLLALGVIILQLARSRREETRQVMWITLGMAGGYLPFLALYLLPRVIGFDAPQLVRAVSVIPLALVPLSFAYAILRYRLWDIAIIVRDVTTYALTLLLGVFGFSILNLAIDRGVPQDLTIARQMLTFLSALLVAGLLIPTRQGISSTLQRFHYRGNYRRRRALSQFAHDLLHERNLESLSTSLLHELEDGLDLEQTNLYLVEGDRLVPILDEQPPTEHGARSGQLGINQPPLSVQQLGDHIWDQDFESITAISLPDARLESMQILFLLGYRYAFPLTVRGRRVGVLVAGYKQEQVPLNSDDLLLIRQLLNQASLAIENAQLVEQLQRQLTEVLELKQFNEEIIESSPAGIVVIDREDKVVTANLAFSDLVGLDRLQVRRRLLTELLPIERTPTPGDGMLGLQMKDKSGRDRYVQLSVASFLGNSPAELRVLALQDVTERILMERRLKEQERLAALGIMAAGVAHEVNTPLTGISSYAQMLLAQTPKEDHRHAVLKKVERQTFRAARIVNSLLEFARSSDPDSQPVDLVVVTQEAIDLLEHQLEEKKIVVLWENVPEPAPCVRGNEGELHQVVTNLVLNAIDAMSDEDLRQLRVSIETDEEWATAYVKDTGTGIDPDKLDQIFQPFFSTKADSGGTGLGLSISHEIMRRNGGELSAHNLPEGGSCFVLRIPLFRTPDQAEATVDNVAEEVTDRVMGDRS